MYTFSNSAFPDAKISSNFEGIPFTFTSLIPALTVFSAGIALPLDIREAQTSDFLFFSPDYQLTKLVQRFAFNLSHWLFASQYLKTSLIFPRLFKEIKLELSFSDAAPETSIS